MPTWLRDASCSQPGVRWDGEVMQRSGKEMPEEGSTLRGLVKRYMRGLALEKGCGKVGEGARGYEKGHLLTYPGVDPS